MLSFGGTFNLRRKAQGSTGKTTSLFRRRSSTIRHRISRTVQFSPKKHFYCTPYHSCASLSLSLSALRWAALVVVLRDTGSPERFSSGRKKHFLCTPLLRSLSLSLSLRKRERGHVIAQDILLRRRRTDRQTTLYTRRVCVIMTLSPRCIEERKILKAPSLISLKKKHMFCLGF